MQTFSIHYYIHLQVMAQWSETQVTAPGPAVANPTGGVIVETTRQVSVATVSIFIRCNIFSMQPISHSFCQ